MLAARLNYSTRRSKEVSLQTLTAYRKNLWYSIGNDAKKQSSQEHKDLLASDVPYDMLRASDWLFSASLDTWIDSQGSSATCGNRFAKTKNRNKKLRGQETIQWEEKYSLKLSLITSKEKKKILHGIRQYTIKRQIPKEFLPIKVW